MRRLAFLSLLLLAGCSGSDVPSGSPYDQQSAETFSLQLKQFRTIDDHKVLHWFQEYVSGYKEPDESQIPTTLTALQTSSGCTLPKPDPASKLVQVITWDSKRRVPLYAIDDDKLKYLTQKFMAIVGLNRGPNMSLNKPDGQMKPVDVVVTETAHPVHLVLASTGPVLWNLITAENARISGITIISNSRTVALANAPADVPVHTLAGEAAAKCGAIPALMPVEQYPNIKMQLHRANDNKAEYAKRMVKYEAYNSYFRRQFGVDSDSVSIGASIMDHAAVGPVPADLAARVPFRTLDKASIKITPAAFVFYGSENDYYAAKKAAVVKKASEMTGSNYQAVLDKTGY